MNKKQFLRKLEKNIRQDPDPLFIKKLKENLQQKAPVFLESQGSPSYQPQWKIAFAVFSFLAVTGGIFGILTITSSLQKDKVLNIIDRAYAVYYEEANTDGILHRKILYQGPNQFGMDSYITESWLSPDEQSFLILYRNPEDESIFDAYMYKKENGGNEDYLYGNINKLLEILKKDDPNMLDTWEYDFTGELMNVFPPMINNNISNKDLASLILDLQMVSGIGMGNMINEKNVFSFDVTNIINETPKKLLTITIDKSDGSVKTVNPLSGSSLTRDYENTILADLLADINTNPNINEMLTDYRTVHEGQYHCFDLKDTGDMTLNTVLQISENNPLVFELYGSGMPNETPGEETELQNMENNLYNITQAKLPPEEILEILETLKTQKEVDYKRVNDNDEIYDVFTLDIMGQTTSYYFDADSYRLRKTQNIPYEKDPNVTITEVYLETDLLPLSEEDSIFNPEKYDLFKDQKMISIWEPLPGMEPGCYNASDKKLTEAEQSALFKQLSPDTLEQYDEFKKSIFENTIPEAAN